MLTAGVESTGGVAGAGDAVKGGFGEVGEGREDLRVGIEGEMDGVAVFSLAVPLSEVLRERDAGRTSELDGARAWALSAWLMTPNSCSCQLNLALP